MLIAVTAWLRQAFVARKPSKASPVASDYTSAVQFLPYSRDRWYPARYCFSIRNRLHLRRWRFSSMRNFRESRACPWRRKLRSKILSYLWIVWYLREKLSRSRSVLAYPTAPSLRPTSSRCSHQLRQPTPLISTQAWIPRMPRQTPSRTTSSTIWPSWAARQSPRTPQPKSSNRPLSSSSRDNYK